jgi:DNA-directed RNA polymerase beta' subunit
LSHERVCTLPQAKEEVKKLIEKAQSNDLEAQPGRTIMESFENQVPVRCAQQDVYLKPKPTKPGV